MRSRPGYLFLVLLVVLRCSKHQWVEPINVLVSIYQKENKQEASDAEWKRYGRLQQLEEAVFEAWEKVSEQFKQYVFCTLFVEIN